LRLAKQVLASFQGLPVMVVPYNPPQGGAKASPFWYQMAIWTAGQTQPVGRVACNHSFHLAVFRADIFQKID
jgi:hypothetical protein